MEHKNLSDFFKKMLLDHNLIILITVHTLLNIHLTVIILFPLVPTDHFYSYFPTKRICAFLVYQLT
jgi:hypothetical protein